ncbi:HAD family hydrolase [Streptomyces meridianus]|uniref:HAD-IA family hydrolase n=1 Tax=Streptomyces meridianus TaxID=2938945 RepID=A0ABT0XCS9_9ACTN|nr:HAD-IA family hydrolase [Streptomyces meridianus]MCM2580329.1 HAD-IA family hydrolase [Streptomyces meridianus]
MKPGPAAGHGASRHGIAPVLRRVRAVVFDTDGVIIDSAGIHAVAWKRAFDACLRERASGSAARPFDPDDDYRTYVDGKSRFDGALAFLDSRGLGRPQGEPGDPPGTGSVWAVAAAKDAKFDEWLREHRVEAWPGTVQLLHALRLEQVSCAAVSASRHARDLLSMSGVAELFHVIVDGNDAARLRLPGKPDPALFLEAARRLGTPPCATAVAEDAVSGTEAARRGGFAVVIGVERSARGAATARLERHGADMVVGDLSELLTPAGPAAGPRTAGPRAVEPG